MPQDLAVGQAAPDFRLPNQDGRSVSLQEFRGRPVVLYFYPKDDTPGCTKEACGFRDALASLQSRQAAVLGVSLDSPESHRRFMEKYRLPFPLLADQDGTVSRAFGVYREKNLYGKKSWGIERSTFIIDPQGKLKAIFRQVKVDQHVEDVLVALDASAS